MYEIVIGRNKEDREKYGLQGTVLIGKHYVKMGQTTSLSNKIFMDVSRSHVVFVVGKRGTGKSYTMGVIAEGITDLPPEIKNNISIILLDTMGIYWTMKYPNNKDRELLSEWGMEGRGLDVQIFTPSGYYEEYKEAGIPTDFPFSIKTNDLDASDWCMTFSVDMNDPLGVLIERVVDELKESKKDYGIDDIVNKIKKDAHSEKKEKDAALNRFLSAKKWGLFSKEGTPLKELILPGQVTVLDVSCYTTMSSASNIRALVIGLVAEKMFIERMVSRKKEEHEALEKEMHLFSREEGGKREPLVWLVVDECLPYNSIVQTEHGPKKIGKIVNDFFKGKKIKVVGYDSSTKKYGLYPITKCYKRPERELMAFITETGKSITCTPDHKILSSNGFCEAQKAKNIAVPLLKPYTQDKRHIEARLLGAIFGDGWLATDGKSVGFSGKGNNTDLEKIKQDLKFLGFKSSSIHSKRTQSKISSSKGKVAYVKGISHSIKSSTKAHKHFRKLGAPTGTKVLTASNVPSWILNGSKEVKCEFLAALMGADGYTLKRNINIPSDFNPIRISFNKIKSLEKNAFNFAKQLKRIFGDVGVKISNITKRSGNLRKDGHETIKIQMTIAKSVDNTINYLKNIGYRYCQKKEIEGKKWLEYLNCRRYILRKRNNLRVKALKLYKEKSLGKTRIGRILGLPDYVIREWIYYKRKAGVPKKFFSFEEWTKRRISWNNLFIKIIKKTKSKKEVVYDLSVENVHNFIADGFLVHNCHEFLPNEGTTTASQPLITILREGRQPGISLILASQQPGKIHTDVMTQADIVIAHRVTANIDAEALGALMQTYMRAGLDKELNNLPRVKGAAIVFDDVNEKMYPMRVRPRLTWHGGEAPSAILSKKKVFEF